jgi:hypothetical protein
MILHLSAKLAKRLKCEISWQGAAVLQSGRIDSWSGDCLRIGRVQHLLMMNDHCLYSILLRAKGMNSLAAFLTAFLPRVAEVWQNHGAEFDPSNQEILVLKRANRSLIGSMNDAVRMIQFHTAGVPPLTNREALEDRLNSAHFKALGFETPKELLARRLARK